MRTFVHGEKFRVTEIALKNDGIEFRLYSDSYSEIRYYANLKIPFPSKTNVPATDAFLATVAKVLTVVPVQDQPTPDAAPAESKYAPVPAPTSYQEAAPPPPPPASVPTISIGMTKEQVTAGFGEPMRKAVIGVKEIYFYSVLKMKVMFTNGIVSDIDYSHCCRIDGTSYNTDDDALRTSCSRSQPGSGRKAGIAVGRGGD